MEENGMRPTRIELATFGLKGQGPLEEHLALADKSLPRLLRDVAEM
jgi:hypothetical protein